MDDVSQYDEEPSAPDDSDTQPLRPSEPTYPPPYAHHPPPQAPSQPQAQPQRSPAPSRSPAPGAAAAPVQHPPHQQHYPPRHAAPGPYASPTTPFPTPYARQQQQKARMPGWAWPVLVVLALVVGSVGGAVAGALVSGLGDNSNVPIIGADSGPASPLKADNGSISAVAAKVLPSTVQVQAKGGSDGSPGGGATGSGFVLDDKDHVITNNHVVADATGPGQLKVVDSAGREHAAKIVGRSPVYDIAVLEVSNPHGLRPAAIGSSRRPAGRRHRGGDRVAAGPVQHRHLRHHQRDRPTRHHRQRRRSRRTSTRSRPTPRSTRATPVARWSNMRGQVIGVNSAIATTGGAIGGEAGNIGVGLRDPDGAGAGHRQRRSSPPARPRYPVIGASVNTGQERRREGVGRPGGHSGRRRRA